MRQNMSLISFFLLTSILLYRPIIIYAEDVPTFTDSDLERYGGQSGQPVDDQDEVPPALPQRPASQSLTIVTQEGGRPKLVYTPEKKSGIAQTKEQGLKNYEGKSLRAVRSKDDYQTTQRPDNESWGSTLGNEHENYLADLNSADVIIRIKAATELGKSHDIDGVKVALKDRDKKVRHAASRCRGRC